MRRGPVAPVLHLSARCAFGILLFLFSVAAQLCAANAFARSRHTHSIGSYLLNKQLQREQRRVGAEHGSYAHEAPLLRLAFVADDVAATALDEATRSRRDATPVALPPAHLLQRNLVCDNHNSETTSHDTASNVLQQVPVLRNLLSANSLTHVNGSSNTAAAKTAERAFPAGDDESYCDEAHTELQPSIIICEFDSQFRETHHDKFAFHSTHFTQLVPVDRVHIVEHLEGAGKHALRTTATAVDAPSQHTNIFVNLQYDDHGVALRSAEALPSWLCAAVHRTKEQVMDVHDLEIDCGYDVHKFSTLGIRERFRDAAATANAADPHSGGGLDAALSAAAEAFVDEMDNQFFNATNRRLPNELPLPSQLDASSVLQRLVEEASHHLMARLRRRGVLHRLQSNHFELKAKSAAAPADDVSAESAGGQSEDDEVVWSVKDALAHTGAQHATVPFDAVPFVEFIGSRICTARYHLSRKGQRSSKRVSTFSRSALKSQAFGIGLVLVLLMTCCVARRCRRRKTVAVATASTGAAAPACVTVSD